MFKPNRGLHQVRALDGPGTTCSGQQGTCSIHSQRATEAAQLALPGTPPTGVTASEPSSPHAIEGLVRSNGPTLPTSSWPKFAVNEGWPLLAKTRNEFMNPCTGRAPRCIARMFSPGARSAIVIAAIAFVLTGCATNHPMMPTPVLYTGANARPLFTELSIDSRRPPLDLLFITDRAPAGKSG